MLLAELSVHWLSARHRLDHLAWLMSMQVGAWPPADLGTPHIPSRLAAPRTQACTHAHPDCAPPAEPGPQILNPRPTYRTLGSQQLLVDRPQAQDFLAGCADQGPRAPAVLCLAAPLRHMGCVDCIAPLARTQRACS